MARKACMRSWCAAATSAVSSLVTMTDTYASLASVRGIQKCGSESIFACLDARSAANSVRSAMSISLDSEKDPSEGPTEVTLPKVLSKVCAVS